MHVVATAGHVDHGKSTLVEALTGTHPDRLAEERRRGLTIELGHASTTLPGAGEVAFVDVPGHERFLRTMLAGVGPVPAALLVVAADDPWMPQAAEHLAALAALGVTRAVVAVTRTDLADPDPMAARAAEELARTPLAGSPVVPVSAVTGVGLDDLRRELAALVAGLPAPPADADVRLWLDRSFHVRGAGTVVTGTLPAGTVRVGDHLSTGTGTVRVRGLETLGSPADQVSGVARVALNVVGDDRAPLARDGVLVSCDAFHFTPTLDVRLAPQGYGGGSAAPPERAVLHVGAVATAAHLRPLDGDLARLTLDRALPLRVGDRAVLRDPGSRRLWGVSVLDPAPPGLRRRGAARRRAEALTSSAPGLAGELDRRGVVPVDLLRRIGVDVPAGEAREWLVGDRAAGLLRARMVELVARHDEERPLDPGVPVAALARSLRLPSPDVLPGLVAPPLVLAGGRVTTAGRPAGLPASLERRLAAVAADLAPAPFAAPTAGRLAELGLDRAAVGAAAKAGRLLDLGSGVVLLPSAEELAVDRLRELPQPFTTSEARQRLGTSRRVVLPLLDRLDRRGRTERHPDDRRSVR